ncbi:MAG: DUF1573 domain-containing protein [Muribaculaceae bacterium]|nr:DUF1573 domain-containing protein [Muribaculaceae bacterium]
MITLRKLLSLISLLPLAAAAQSPSVTWLQTTHDFGAFNEDLGAVDATFLMVNTGDKPVRILDARATCGCTVPQFPKEEIAPGDTARIVATYLSSGRPGKFSKNIYIRTSAEPTKQQTLTVSGTVIGASSTLASRFPVVGGPLRISNKTAAFGEVLRGKLKTVYIEGYNQSADTVRPRLTGLPDFINARLTPPVVPPGEQMQLSLTLQTLHASDWGINTGDFGLIAAEGDTLEMDYFAIISEDFSQLTPGQRINAPVASLTPGRVDLGELTDLSPRRLTFELRNSGKSPLEIRRVQIADPVLSDLEVSSTKVKPGKSARITLTFSPANAAADFIAARLTVICNDPENPLITSRITAEINEPSRKQQ